MDDRSLRAYGQAAAQQLSPPREAYRYEKAATVWTQARERLERAVPAATAAAHELEEARQAEEAAWEELLAAADRGPKQAMPETCGGPQVQAARQR